MNIQSAKSMKSVIPYLHSHRPSRARSVLNLRVEKGVRCECGWKTTDFADSTDREGNGGRGKPPFGSPRIRAYMASRQPRRADFIAFLARLSLPLSLSPVAAAFPLWREAQTSRSVSGRPAIAEAACR